MTPQPLSRVASSFVKAAVLDRDTAAKIQQEATTAKISFVSHAVKSKAVGAATAAQVLAEQFGVPYFDITALNPSVLNPDLLKKDVVVEHRVLPLWVRGRNIVVALSDPSDTETIQSIKFASSMSVDVVVCDDDKLQVAVDKFLSGTESSMKELVGNSDINFAVEENEEEKKEDIEALTDEAADNPVVKFVNKMLFDAISLGASDLHFEPYEKFYRVRFRVDGILKEMAQPPRAYVEKIAARIKVMSRLDVSEKRIPQDGRTKLRVSAEKVIDFRVSTCPMLHGEKIVMRILDPSSATLGIEALGYDPDQKENLLNAVQRPYGMVLVTGPTGSGKQCRCTPA